MGFFGAIRSCYANIFNFSGRARRKEYWYFFLFQVLVAMALQVALVYIVLADGFDFEGWIASFADAEKPGDLSGFAMFEQIAAYYLWYCLAYFFLIWLPQLAVTVRRLHDTDHSGWLLLLPFAVTIGGAIGGGILAAIMPELGLPILVMVAGFLPFLIYLYIFVLLCIPGSYGNNRFGPDPVPGRKPKEPIHPIYAPRPSADDQREIQAQRRAEIKELYRTRVLKGQGT